MKRADRAPTRLSPLGLTLRAGLTGVAVAAPVALALSGALGGTRGLLSGAAGLALVAVFFLVSMVLVERANTVGPALTLPVALTVYGIKVVILGVIVFGTDAVSHLNAAAFCWSVVGATLAWLVAHAVAVWRTKMPYLQFEGASADVISDATSGVIPATTPEVTAQVSSAQGRKGGAEQRPS